MFSWDTETEAFTDLNPHPQIVCSSFAGANEEFYSWLRGQDDVLIQKNRALVPGRLTLACLQKLDALGEDILGHNTAYDWMCLIHNQPEARPLCYRLYEGGKVLDTKIRESLFRIAKGWLDYDPRQNTTSPKTDLATLVKIYFKQDISASKKQDAWRLRYGELKDTPLRAWPEEAIEYALDDASWTLGVYHYQNKVAADVGYNFLSPQNRFADELRQTKANLVLTWISHNGVKTDPAKVMEFDRRVRATAAIADAKAKELGFLRINRCKNTYCEGTGRYENGQVCPDCQGLDEAQRLAQGLGKFRGFKAFDTAKHMGRLRKRVVAAYAKFEEEPPKTPSGEIQTGAEVLAESHDPELQAYAKCLSAVKLLDTYVPIAWSGTQHPIHAGYNVLVSSGRTSSFKPNMQNPPRGFGFRDIFVPAPGYVFASIDYAYQELVCLAQVCKELFGYSRLGDYINEGKDPHSAFAAEHFMGISYEEFEERRAKGDKECKQARQYAKAANFGYPGGLGPGGFIKYAKGMGIEVSLEQSKEIKAKWLQAYPELVQYFDYIRRTLPRTPWQEHLPLKERVRAKATFLQLYSNRVRGQASFTEAANTLFQGLAADASKDALWSVFVKAYLQPEPELEGVTIWNFVHDELLLQGPEGTAHVWAPRVADLMVEALSNLCRDIKCRAEPALMRQWLKDAEPVFDSEGKLVPYLKKESK